MGLDDVTYRTGKMEYRSRHATEPESVLDRYLEEAAAAIAAAETEAGLAGGERQELAAEIEELRWFPLPEEVEGELEGRAKAPPACGLLHVSS